LSPISWISFASEDRKLGAILAVALGVRSGTATRGDDHMTTRRDFIQRLTATAACIGAAPPAAADTPDPIFAAIAAHREALRAWDDALTVVGEFDGKRFARYRAGLEDDDDPEHLAADQRAREHAEALCEFETDAHLALIETATTLPGTLAALRYVMGYYSGQSELFPGRRHDLLDDESLLTFVEKIGDAIEAAIAPKGGRS
jgi:hypothetical protein